MLKAKIFYFAIALLVIYYATTQLTQIIPFK